MAVNHCDGLMFASVPTVYPIFAAMGAASAGAHWSSVAFAPIGLAIGVATVWAGRPIVYSVVGFGHKRCEGIRPEWLQGILGLPFFLWYLLTPLAFIGLGTWASYSSSALLAKLLL